MPPRIPFQPSLKAFNGSSHVQSPLARLSLNFSTTSARAGSAEARERRRHDPYLISQSRQRKAANLSRRQALAEERGSIGDPVIGKPTPFAESLKVSQYGPQESYPNHYLSPGEIDNALERSKHLTSPITDPNSATADPQLEKEAAEKHLEEHRNAQEAINRIVNIRNGNLDDQIRLRIQRCIETFGRHNTDQTLPPKPAAVPPEGAVAAQEKTPRVGPDTGSPEVQVAILTAKILNLTRHLEGTNKDKHNKRNLRLLVHKRQKLLRYLRRKERGGPRWKYLMETLGLSDASWQGEITM